MYKAETHFGLACISLYFEIPMYVYIPFGDMDNFHRFAWQGTLSIK